MPRPRASPKELRKAVERHRATFLYFAVKCRYRKKTRFSTREYTCALKGDKECCLEQCPL